MHQPSQRGIGNRCCHLRRAAARHTHDRYMEVRLRDIVEQFLQRAACQRVFEVRRDFHAGFQHESASGHSGMRQCERLAVEHKIVVEQNVEVHCARSPSVAPLTVKRVFDCRQHVQHIVRGQIGLDQAGTIQERLLPWRSANGPRFSEAACD